MRREVAGIALGIAFASAIATPVQAGQISRNSLVQYQYHVDVPQCNLTLSNGIRVEFDGVFANEAENVVFYQLIIMGIPTKRAFRYASVIRLSLYDESFLAKVVKQDANRVFLALDSTFLNLFWGTEGAETFSISDVDVGATSQTESFSTPFDTAAARLVLSKGQSCHEAAMAAN